MLGQLDLVLSHCSKGTPSQGGGSQVCRKVLRLLPAGEAETACSSQATPHWHSFDIWGFLIGFPCALSVCVECFIGKQKKAILFKVVTVPSCSLVVKVLGCDLCCLGHLQKALALEGTVHNGGGK